MGVWTRGFGSQRKEAGLGQNRQRRRSALSPSGSLLRMLGPKSQERPMWCARLVCESRTIWALWVYDVISPARESDGCR